MKISEKVYRFFLIALEALGLVAVTTVAGLLFGNLLLNVITHHVPHGRWQAVDIGQEKAVRFLGAHEVATLVIEYYVTTAKGNIYLCENESCRIISPAEVELVEDDNNSFEGCPSFAIPWLPGKERDSFVITWCGLCSGQTSAVILDDGSLWFWDTVGCCEVGCLINIGYYICGLGIGYISLAVIIYYRRKRKKKSNNEQTWSSHIAKE